MMEAIAYRQNQDREFYRRARLGYDVTTGEQDAAALQRYAAKRSAATRAMLFELIEGAS